MKSREEIEVRIFGLRAELVGLEDGLDIMLISRSILELEWVLGRQEALHG